jgi:hypothetical protein
LFCTALVNDLGIQRSPRALSQGILESRAKECFRGKVYLSVQRRLWIRADVRFFSSISNMAEQALPQQPGVPATDPQPPRTEKPIYTPLSNDEIRLAVLRPNADLDQPIRVDLITSTWPPPLPYEALSYVWGDAAVQSTIHIESVDGLPQPYPVTTNLSVALRHLRRGDRDRPMWIDALCIDQDNVEEKEQQVSKMDQIYQAAYKVCVWLGPGSDVSDRAMAAVPKILRSISRSKRLSEQDWELFAHLLQREWFSRRWVVQEIALAKAATVRCGRKVVSWTDFSDAISLYVSRQARTWSSVATALVASELGASTLSSISDNALRKDGQGNIIERRWPLEDLLAQLPMFQVQVPHDAIYSILSVASDSAALPPVDYSKPPAELFTEVFQRIAESSKSLDMMFRPWAPEIPGERLPSFIMPASRRTHILGAGGLHERRNADSLVGAPRRRIYSATPHLTTSPVVAQPFLDAPKNPPPATIQRIIDAGAPPGWKPRVTLPTRGVICTIITEVSSVCENGIISQDWLEAWRDQGQLRPDIWRVLVAGRSHDGSAAPNWYRRAFDNLVAHGSSSGLGLNLPDMIKESPSSTMAEFLRRVSACTWGRRYLISTRDKPGFFGLVPREAAPGDMICLFEGCSVPVVFRGKPVNDWVLQALETVPQRYLESKSLTAYMGEQITQAMQDDLFSDLEGHIMNALTIIKKSSPSTHGESQRALWPEPLDSPARAFRLPPDWEDGGRFRELFQSRLTPAFMECLTMVVVSALQKTKMYRGLRMGGKHMMLPLALEYFFGGLMRASLHRPSNAVLLPEPSVQPRNPSWADAPLSQLFGPCLERAYKQAATQSWRREAGRMLILPGLRFKFDPIDHPRAFHVLAKVRDEEVEAAWPKVQEQVLVSLERSVADLCFEGLGIGTWEKPLQNAVKTWTEKALGEPAAYGGEIVGECYVQGLMDGEWWSTSRRKKPHQTRTFFIG